MNCTCLHVGWWRHRIMKSMEITWQPRKKGEPGDRCRPHKWSSRLWASFGMSRADDIGSCLCYGTRVRMEAGWHCSTHKALGKKRLKRTDDGTAFINVRSVFTLHKAADAVLNICAASLIHKILRVNILRKKLKIRCVSGRSKSHGVLSCTIYFNPLNLLLF